MRGDLEDSTKPISAISIRPIVPSAKQRANRGGSPRPRAVEQLIATSIPWGAGVARGHSCVPASSCGNADSSPGTRKGRDKARRNLSPNWFLSEPIQGGDGSTLGLTGSPPLTPSTAAANGRSSGQVLLPPRFSTAKVSGHAPTNTFLTRGSLVS